MKKRIISDCVAANSLNVCKAYRHAKNIIGKLVFRFGHDNLRHFHSTLSSSNPYTHTFPIRIKNKNMSTTDNAQAIAHTCMAVLVLFCSILPFQCFLPALVI